MSRLHGIRRTKYDEPIGNLNTYFGYRTKRPPPKLDNDDAPPGRVCWGEVGDLPTAELPPTTGFEIVDCDEKHAEVSRKTQDVRIENPENNQNWVEVERPNEFLMNKTEKKTSPNSNTDSASADLGPFLADEIRENFKSVDSDKTNKCKLTVTIKNTQRAA